MKYVSPEYKNEKVNVNDVITNSFTISEGTMKDENGNDQKTVTVTGYLSHLLAGM